MYLIYTVEKLDWTKLGDKNSLKSKIAGNTDQFDSLTQTANTPPTPINTNRESQLKPKQYNPSMSQYSDSNLQRKTGHRPVPPPSPSPYGTNLRLNELPAYRGGYDDPSNYYPNEPSPYNWMDELTKYRSGDSRASERQSLYPSWLSANIRQPDSRQPVDNDWYGGRSDSRSHVSPYSNRKLIDYDYDTLRYPSYKYPSRSNVNERPEARPQLLPHEHLDSEPKSTRQPAGHPADEKSSHMAYGNWHVVVVVATL